VTSFRDKLDELRAMPPDLVEVEAASFMEQVAEWPVNTQIPLLHLAFVVVALSNEPDVNVRRVRITESLSLKDGLS
jgi:hypothetical protein